MAGRKSYLPKKGTQEWEELVAEFLTTTSRELHRMAERLGFSSSSSLTSCMIHHGIWRSARNANVPRYDDPPMIQGSTLITCDEQIPYHDAEFLQRVLDLAHAWGVKEGVSAGDTLDETAFSKFGHLPHVTWEDEAAEAMALLPTMTGAVPSWLMLAGNHTVHLIKQTAEQLQMRDILWLLDKPKGWSATNYYKCIVNDTWLVCHPRNISVIAGRIPTVLCRKYHMNIAAGHGHLVGMNPDESGQYVAVDIGIIADPLKLDYNALRPNTRPVMAQGALILKQDGDGRTWPYLLSPLWTDWQAMKKLYKREI